ncbi:MAG TPA: hypothetical protein VMH28_28800 [Candidatus Acidoferrales bacterium]|nr:hypothetical protein [Candidatus Acidoferrales bacterium]
MIRQRLQEHGIDYAEYSRIGAHAERHDQDGECGESRAPAQVAAAIPQVPQQISDIVDAAHIAALLLKMRNISHRGLRHPAGFVRRHAASDVFFRELIQMEPKFGFEFTVYVAAEEQGTQAQAEFILCAHVRPPG